MQLEVGQVNWSTPRGGYHVCNCIGCCERCGMCRTDPRHDAVTCAKIADLNAQRAEILGQTGRITSG